MNEKPEQQSPSAETVPDVAMPSRRGLLKGLGVGSPVLLTLASAPVQAASVCIMPSGYISAATFNSRHQGASVCTNQGPTFFKSNIGNSSFWPTSGTNTQTVKFRNASLFGIKPDGSSVAAGTNTDTMAQVLSGGYTSDFTKFCIAAYLNARTLPTGWPADLTPAKVVALWRYFKASGVQPTWIPAAWTIADADDWLRDLMSP